ncbi:putative transmembrane protein [Toxoplasma gondii RUB]|uniref:Putative transmembrane protein n=1 Tax=Toxoplasma gondii RUB TaxID=935652 RepID=A0A086LKI0_TOXGO|nr:putative transmembrane protein [Toxoplasma gondii RUB]
MKRRRRSSVSSSRSPSSGCSSHLSGSSVPWLSSRMDCLQRETPILSPPPAQKLRRCSPLRAPNSSMPSRVPPLAVSVTLCLGLLSLLLTQEKSGCLFADAESLHETATASERPSFISASRSRRAVATLPSGQSVHAEAESSLQGEGSHREMVTRVEILLRGQKRKCRGSGMEPTERACSPSAPGETEKASERLPPLACHVECTYTLKNVVYVDPDQTWELGIDANEDASRSGDSLSPSERLSPRISTQVLEDFVDVELPVFSPVLSPYTRTRQKTLAPVFLRRRPEEDVLCSSPAGDSCQGARKGGAETAEASEEIYAASLAFSLPFHLRYDAACASCAGHTHHVLSPPRVRVHCRQPPGEEEERATRNEGEEREEKAKHKEKKGREGEEKTEEQEGADEQLTSVACEGELCVVSLVFEATVAREVGKARAEEGRELPSSTAETETSESGTNTQETDGLYLQVPVGFLAHFVPVVCLTALAVAVFSGGTLAALLLAERHGDAKPEVSEVDSGEDSLGATRSETRRWKETRTCTERD